jgi:hypothetical protein
MKKVNINKEYQKEYEDYMKDIVNKFSELCSVKMDYQDYCNYVLERDRDTRYTFWHPHERIFIDMMLDGSFETDGVKDKILKRQDAAKKWLSENLLTYDEWVAKHKN